MTPRPWISPLMGKLAAITILILLLLIPKSMVMSVIEERQQRRDEAREEISAKWGGRQTLVGPLLVLPYEVLVQTERNTADNKKEITNVRETRYAFFLPDKLDIEVQAETQLRYRGIFEAILYQARVKVLATFPHPSLKSLPVNPTQVFWSKAVLLQGVSDIRGIQKDAALTWDGVPTSLEPGLPVGNVADAGIHADLALSPSGSSHKVELNCSLNGAETLFFSPLGRETHATFKSAWPHPSFQGAFLPLERKVEAQGFEASWQIPHLARNFPQSWSGKGPSDGDLAGAAFGVSFLIPVDAYQTTTRSAKYGVLFLALTFLVFFLFEVLMGARIHPIQYLLVGFGLLLFYVLLLALSEHMLFGLAYALAAAAVLALVTAYSASVLWNWRKARIIGVILAFLYAYLYTLLKVEDYAMLLGSLGLLLALAIVMYATRKVDWYQLGGESRKD